MQLPQKTEEQTSCQLHLLEVSSISEFRFSSHTTLHNLLYTTYPTPPTLQCTNTLLYEYLVHAPCSQHLSTQQGIKLTSKGQHTVTVDPTAGTHLPQVEGQKMFHERQTIQIPLWPKQANEIVKTEISKKPNAEREII